MVLFLISCELLTCREYPEYRFHALRYPRKEFLDLALSHPHLTYHQGTDYVDEMLFSLANLYVASEAHAFVGTLSSNWCMMVRPPLVLVFLLMVWFSISFMLLLFFASRLCS